MNFKRVSLIYASVMLAILTPLAQASAREIKIFPGIQAKDGFYYSGCANLGVTSGECTKASSVVAAEMFCKDNGYDGFVSYELSEGWVFHSVDQLMYHDNTTYPEHLKGWYVAMSNVSLGPTVCFKN